MTEDGEPVGVLVSVEDFESWQETLAIAADPDAMGRIATAEEEADAGETVPWAQVVVERHSGRAG